MPSPHTIAIIKTEYFASAKAIHTDAALAQLAEGIRGELADEAAGRIAAERNKRDAIFAECAAKKVKVPGMSKAQRRTLDAMHPTGWTVACWTSPGEPRNPNDNQLSESDNPNLFGGCHYVVNGEHVLITRRGKWLGHYAWGGLQYRTNGARRPWNAIVSDAAAAGYYGPHRTPPRAKILRSLSL